MPYPEPSNQADRVSEADICRQYVVPMLQSASWDTDLHFITEQRTVAPGCILPVTKGFIRSLEHTLAFGLRLSSLPPPAVNQLQSLLYAD